MILIKECDYGYLDAVCFEMANIKINGVVKELIEMVYGKIYVKKFNIHIITSELGDWAIAIEDLLEECHAPTCKNKDIAVAITKEYKKFINNKFFRK